MRRFRGRGGRWTRPRTAMTSQLHGIWPESGSGGPVGGVRFEISNGGSCRRRMRVGLRGRVRSRNEAGYELCGCASTAWGVGRRGRGCKRLGVRRPRGAGAAGARMRAFGRTSTTCGSRGEGRVVVARTSWRGVACVGLWLTSDGLWLCCCAMNGGDGGELHRSSRGKRPAYGCHAATAVTDSTALPLWATAVNVAASGFGAVTFRDWRGG